MVLSLGMILFPTMSAVLNLISFISSDSVGIGEYDYISCRQSCVESLGKNANHRLAYEGAPHQR